MLKAGWIPRRVELPVGHAVLGIGTAVDLFCTNAQGQAILIEVKVAGSANWQENAFTLFWSAISGGSHAP